MIYKGKDREEYTWTAARERDRKLRDFFGQGLWKWLWSRGAEVFSESAENGSKHSRLIPVSG